MPIIKHKRSATPGKAPEATDLADGELAINTADGRVFLTRDSEEDKAVVEVLTDAPQALTPEQKEQVRENIDVHPVNYKPQTLTPEQQEQARENLGATEIGDALFTAANAEAAREDLGATEVGHALFTAANKITARENIGIMSLPKGISGLLLSNYPPAPLTTIAVSAGVARDSTDTVEIRLNAGFTKRIDLNWAQGNGAGGLDTGSRVAFHGYHIFVILNSTTGDVDVLISASALNPALPSGYEYFRRIGACYTNSNGGIYSGIWYPSGDFVYKPPVAHSVPQPSAGISIFTTLVPKGVKMLARYAFAVLDSGASSPQYGVVFRDYDLGPPSGGNTTSNYAAWKDAGVASVAFVESWTDNLARVNIGSLNVSETQSFGNPYVVGWFDARDDFS